MNCRKCRINLLFFPLLKVKKNAFFIFLFNFQSTKKRCHNKLTKNQHNGNYEQTEIDILML